MVSGGPSAQELLVRATYGGLAVITDKAADAVDANAHRLRLEDAADRAPFGFASNRAGHSDRIHLYLAVSPGLEPVLEAYGDYIMSETLALELHQDTPPQGLPATSAAFEGEQMTIALRKAGPA
jgi:hypothetical protein